MPRRTRLKLHLTDDELHSRYRRVTDSVERSHWHFLWLLASGLTATDVVAITGYSAYWIGQIARRYNRDGPDGVYDSTTPPVYDGHISPLRDWPSRSTSWQNRLPMPIAGASERRRAR